MRGRGGGRKGEDGEPWIMSVSLDGGEGLPQMEVVSSRAKFENELDKDKLPLSIEADLDFFRPRTSSGGLADRFGDASSSRGSS